MTSSCRTIPLPAPAGAPRFLLPSALLDRESQAQPHVLTLPLTTGSLPRSHSSRSSALSQPRIVFGAPFDLDTRPSSRACRRSSAPPKTSARSQVALQPVRSDFLRFSLLASPLLMRLILKVCFSDMPPRSISPTHLVFFRPYLLELRSCLPPGSNVCFLPSHPVKARVRRLARAEHAGRQAVWSHRTCR